MKEKNILLISMSTLYDPAESYYENIEKGKSGSYESFFRGVSQLEAGTKFFLRKLQKSGKPERKIDGIFIVESVMSRKPLAQEEQPVLASFLDGIVPKENLSAVDFYKERIKQYIQGEEKSHPKDEKEEALNKKIIAYENRMALLQSSYDVDKLFIDIKFNDVSDEGKTNNNAIYQCVKDLCEEIQDFAEGGEGISKTNLFLDIQGARRYESFIINASVKMLESRGITVESSVATDYSGNTNAEGKFNRIVDTTFNDRIFEMVSGMNEFIKTGRGDTLLEFQKHSKDMINLEAEKGILDTIKNISEAISICDVQKFEEGLRQFDGKIREYEGKENKNLLFQTYVSDLKNDYQNYKLLGGNKPEIENEIKWCLDKKLYQQALTLVEAKIPSLLVDEEILYYHGLRELKDFLYALRNKGWKSMPKYLWYWDYGNIQITPDNAKYAFIKYVLTGTDREGNRNGLQLTEILQGIAGVNWESGNRPVTWDEQSIVGDFLADYSDLCAYRNDVNHASRSSPNAAQLKQKINKLVNDYEVKLKKNNISIDLSKYIYLT